MSSSVYVRCPNQQNFPEKEEKAFMYNMFLIHHLDGTFSTENSSKPVNNAYTKSTWINLKSVRTESTSKDT